MANIATTDLNRNSVAIGCCEHRDETFTAGGAVTYKKGTILARDSVSKKLVPYVKSGVTNENGIPKAVLTYELVATGAGDIAIRALVSGTVSKNALVILADGDDANIDTVELDGLRSFSIVAIDTAQLARDDNPQENDS